MKPHVAQVVVVAEKCLRMAGCVDPVKLLLPVMHSLEGEKAVETAARMVTIGIQQSGINSYEENSKMVVKAR